MQESEGEAQVLLHQVSLATALAEVLALHELGARAPKLERLDDLQLVGVLRFTASKLGAYRKPRDAEGFRAPRLRRHVVLAWGARPPLHEVVVGITWDFPHEGAGDAEAAVPPVLGEALHAEVAALVADRAGSARSSSGASTRARGADPPAPPRAATDFAALLRLRSLRGWQVARNLDLPLGDTMRGDESRRGTTFLLDGRYDVDACMRILDERSPPARCRRSARYGAALALHYEVPLETGACELVLLDDPSLGVIAARVATSPSGTVTDLLRALGARPRSEPGESDTGWLQAALEWPRSAVTPPDLAALLEAHDPVLRRRAFEAAVLVGSASSRALLAARLGREEDPTLRADIALVLLLVDGGEVPAPAQVAAVERALGSLREERLRDGLARAAGLNAARLRPVLTELAGLATVSKDVRFVARALLVFLPRG